MSHSVDELWKSVVQLAQQLPALSRSSSCKELPYIHRYVHSINALNSQLDLLSSKKGLPRATWKPLIKELKVPSQLAAICCSMSVDDNGSNNTHSSSSSSSSSCSSTSTSTTSSSSSSNSRAKQFVLAMHAWKALTTFLKTAYADLIQKEGTLNNEAVQRATSTSLPCAIAAQLQHSGLVQQFPSTLLAAAQWLKDVTTTAGASDHGAPASSAQGGQEAAAAAAAAAAATAAGADPGSSSDDTERRSMLLLCGELAAAFALIGAFKPYAELGTEVAALDAGVCFCVAVMQLVTTELDSLSAAAPGPAELYSWYNTPVHNAFGGLVHVVHTVQDSRGERREQLLQSPQIRTAVKVVAGIWYARTLMPDNSSNLGPDSVAAATAAAGAAAAEAERQGCFDWQAAAKPSVLLDPPQQQPPQPPQQQHFEPCREALGVSIHALAWAAAWMGSAELEQACFMVVDSASAMANRFLTAVRLQQEQLELLLQQRQQQLQQQELLPDDVVHLAQETFLLVQPVLSSLAQQPGLLREAFLGCTKSTVEATFTALGLSFVHCIAAVVSWPQEEELSGSHTAPATPAGQVAAAKQTLRQVAQVMAHQTAYMMPTLLTLLELIQQQVFSTRTAQEAAADVCSSGRTSGRPSSSSSLQLGAAEGSAGKLLEPLALALVTAAQLAPPVHPSFCYGALLEEKLRATWSRHSARTCRAFEGCFRLQIGSSKGLTHTSSACALVLQLADSLLQCYRPVAAAVREGPGSAEQRQLFSMLVSLLKVCRALSAVAGVDAALAARRSPQHAASNGCIYVAITAEGCLSHMCDPLPDTHSSAGRMAICDATGSSAAAAAAAATPIDSLPALVLCGRCCLQWAAQLQVLQQQNPDLGERLLLLQDANPDSPDHAAELLQVHSKHAAVALFAGPRASAAGVLRTCRDWLSLGGTAEALAAAGYPAEALLQKLGVLLEHLGLPAAAPDAAAAVAAYGQVVQQLQAVGLAFNTLAFPDACNNPFCSNMSGATELESVSGRANMCGGCLVARYCSKACQASHWKQHKPVCKALRAAAVSDTTKAD